MHVLIFFCNICFKFLSPKQVYYFIHLHGYCCWRYGTVFNFFLSSLRVFINFLFYLCVLRKLRCWSVFLNFFWMLSRVQLKFSDASYCSMGFNSTPKSAVVIILFFYWPEMLLIICVVQVKSRKQSFPGNCFMPCLSKKDFKS